MELILHNVRCFCRPEEIPIKPLTLLVGDNSSGKTTFLAVLAHVSQHDFPSFRPSFSDEPFDLGSYDSIATFKGGRYGRAHEFTIGYSQTIRESTDVRLVKATYSSFKGQPQLSKLVTTTRDGQLSFRISEGQSSGRLALEKEGRKVVFDVELKREIEAFQGLGFFFQSVIFERMQSFDAEDSALFTRSWLYGLMPPYRQDLKPARALAPVRTKPRRTYDEINDDFMPEGEHICKSDDPHIIALARLGRVRLLCTDDDDLATDFKDRRLLSTPRGKVYKNATHRNLIKAACTRV